MDYKDLDVVLNKLNTDKKSTEMQLNHNQDKITSLIRHKELTEEDARLVLNKLCKDGYAEFMIKNNDRYYYINYDGIEFLAQNGYAEKLRLQNLRDKSIRMGSRLKLIVGIGSVIVGSYYFLLLLREFVFPLFCCYH
ncbi:MAG: hypothetical protein COA97_04820 [Flavobacteriales bacterium]|nr:MAG: hypothetical protein COA97_04820 [Flavobacteriales bacterium]